MNLEISITQEFFDKLLIQLNKFSRLAGIGKVKVLEKG